MDLNDTFETNDAADRSHVSQSSARNNSAGVPCSEEPHQQHQTEYSTPPHANKTTNNPHQFGRDVALAMACMEAAERLRNIKSAKTKKAEKSDNKIGNTEIKQPDPKDSEFAGYDIDAGFDRDSDNESKPTLSIKELSAKLHSISAKIDTQRAELIGLLVQFDELEGWEASGAKSCADWCNARLGIAPSSVYEFLRVGRELQELPIINMLFRGGELSWSKIRHLTRVADANNERDLAHVALDATVSDVERICQEFNWAKSDASTIDPETGRTVADLKAEQQYKNRAFSWKDQSDGSVQIKITLPPELAQIILKSVDLCANELYESNSTGSNDSESSDTESNSAESNGVESNTVNDAPATTATQRRADAVVLMAERSIQYAGPDVSRSDRNQVVLHVENSDFVNSSPSTDFPPTESTRFPGKIPWIEGVGPIADSVASRIACDASLVTMLWQDGEPLNVGRQTRIWLTHIRRAIIARDRHCQFPGCNEHRYLDIHHITHWVDDGESSVENGICLCRRHHTLVHQEGYIIERNTVESNTQPGTKDFGATIGLVSPAQKALLPTRYRFRFIKPVSGAKVSGCCGNHSDSQCSENQCNESPLDYRITPPADTSHSEYRVTPPAEISHSEYRVTPPAEMSHSEYRVTPPAEMSHSEYRVTPPAEMSHSEYRVSRHIDKNTSGELSTWRILKKQEQPANREIFSTSRTRQGPPVFH